MKLGCSTLLFSRLQLDEACRNIEALGFRHVDLGMLEGWAHVDPSEADADPDGTADRVRRALGGLSPLSCNASRNNPEATLRLAAAIGAPVVTFPASRPGTPLAAEAAALRGLVVLGRNLGLQVTVETHIGQMTEDVGTAVRLCELVQGLGLTLDPSHYTAGPHQGREFGAVYPYVRHLHVRDASHGGWDEVQTDFGKGKVPWASILMGLRSVGYDDGITVEYVDTLPAGNQVQSTRAAAHAVAAFWYG